MISLNHVKKQLIMMHPTFCCPINKTILDYRKSTIIKYYNPINKKEMTEIVSNDGLNSMDSEKRELLKVQVIDTFEKFLELK
jgi:hypothetical protein